MRGLGLTIYFTGGRSFGCRDAFDVWKADQDNPANFFLDGSSEKVLEVHRVRCGKEAFGMCFEEHAGEVNDAVHSFKRRQKCLRFFEITTKHWRTFLTAKIRRNVTLMNKKTQVVSCEMQEMSAQQ